MDTYFSVNPTSMDCIGYIHPKASEGINLFNAGQYWKAHEALEQAWLEETGEIRHLYRGILQVGVFYLHVQRRNYHGALKVYQRSQRWLTPFPNSCRGIDVHAVKEDSKAVMVEVRRLGPDRLEEFNFALLKPINIKSI